MASALSILAFQIDIMNQQGNLLDAEKGQYFFRDSAIPRVRPATYSAWSHLVGLGRCDPTNSSIFCLPFLPSIRDDEEGGIASSVRGRGTEIHLSTLSRKSKLHMRDSKGSIQWGAVYLGNLSRGQYPIYAQLNRSDVPETMIVPRRYQVPGIDVRTHDGLRQRMEFLAQHGIPAIYNSDIPLRAVRRVLFQITSLESATDWAVAFAECHRICTNDPEAEESDYSQLIHELIEARRKPRIDTPAVLGVEKTVTVKGKKVKMSIDDLTL